MNANLPIGSAATAQTPETLQQVTHGIGAIENDHLQQFLFLIILLMLIASGVQGLNLIDKPSDPTTLHSIAFVFVSVIGCVFAYVLTLQNRTSTAAKVAVFSLAMPVLLHALGGGMGIRSPIIYLWTPPILIAYYAIGINASFLVAAGACAAAALLYGLEMSGYLPVLANAGEAESASNLINLWLVVICGLAAANGIRERKEITLSFARDRRDLLQKALADIEVAEASQRQFMDKISSTVAKQTQVLHGLSHLDASTDISAEKPSLMDTQAILSTSEAMMQALDAAVEQTEKETRFFLNQ